MPEAFNAADYLLTAATRPETADRTALTGPGGDVTYRELAALTGRAAAGLQALGLRPEERVVLFMADGPAMATAILGAMRMGAIPVPLSTMLTGPELAALITDTRARVLLVSAAFAAVVEAALPLTPGVRHVIVAAESDGAGDGWRVPEGVTVHPFGELLERDGEEADRYQTWADSGALWLYTSGTTGRPKAAMHRHTSIRSVVETYGRQVLGITAADRCYSVAKLFFAYGIGNSMFFPLSTGATTILDPRRPTPQSVTEILLDHRPTLFFAVPTFYAALLNAGVPAEAFASVRLAVSAGEPLPADLYRRFTERYGVDILDGIGSTEALHIFLSNRPGNVRPGTTGTVVPGYELRVVDGDGHDVEPGTPGSLMVKGDSIATGYWCRTATTRQVFQGEWLRTGDTYVVDAEGFHTCLGRTGDMLKAGGIWVSPAEVEARLLEHPAVSMAAVVGLPDADGIDKPVACVVLAPETTATPDELIEFCRTGLASFKRPRSVLVVDKLPTTATGKLQRFAVREQAAILLGGR